MYKHLLTLIMLLNKLCINILKINYTAIKTREIKKLKIKKHTLIIEFYKSVKL